MPRIAIAVWEARLQAAYRLDPFHSLCKNLESVLPEEWDLKPSRATSPQEGAPYDDQLSICDLAIHAGGPKYMYANRAFEDGKLEWQQIALPSSREMAVVLAWIEEGHRHLVDGLAGLQDDAALLEERPSHWNQPVRVELLLGIIVNHDVYHAGEINRQRALIRYSGWQ
jgi:hypothetical protein